jgi:hypothetical protein
VKQPLSPRLHIFGDGRTAPIQRDLYSAFLGAALRGRSFRHMPDRREVAGGLTAAATRDAETHQSASEAGAASSMFGNGVGVDRASEIHTLSCEAAHA